MLTRNNKYNFLKTRLMNTLSSLLRSRFLGRHATLPSKGTAFGGSVCEGDYTLSLFSRNSRSLNCPIWLTLAMRFLCTNIIIIFFHHFIQKVSSRHQYKTAPCLQISLFHQYHEKKLWKIQHPLCSYNYVWNHLDESINY